MQPQAMWSPENLRNPYPFYAALRESAPVHVLAAFGGTHAITRYDDIAPILKNPTLFSSQRIAPGLHLPKEVGEQARRFFRAQNNLIASDPPQHTRLRTLVGKAFTPRRIAEMEPRIRAITRQLLESMLAHEEFDLMAELAVPLPVIVISEMLGVEPERRQDFKRWSDHVVQTLALSQGKLYPPPIPASPRAISSARSWRPPRASWRWRTSSPSPACCSWRATRPRRTCSATPWSPCCAPPRSSRVSRPTPPSSPPPSRRRCATRAPSSRSCA